MSVDRIKYVDLRFQAMMEADGWETIGYELFGFNGIPQIAVMVKEENREEYNECQS